MNKDTLRHGTLESNAQGPVVTFRARTQSEQVLKDLKSRPGDGISCLAPMGVYVFRTDALAHLLEENGGYDFAQHTLPGAIKSKRVHAYPYKGYWEDLSGISAFHQANLAMTRPDPPFDLRDPRWTIYTRSRFLLSSQIDGCRPERTLVADGCQLYDADIEECVIGLRTIVRPDARPARWG